MQVIEAVKNIFNYINWVDVLIFIIVIRSLYLGMLNGLTSELFKFLGTVIGLVFAVHYYAKLADIIILNLGLLDWLTKLLCFLIISQILRLAFKYSLLFFLKIISLQFISQLEKPGGAIIGFSRGLICAAVVLLSIGFIPSQYLKDSCGQSLTGLFIVKASQRTYNAVTFWLPEEAKEKNIFFEPASAKA